MKMDAPDSFNDIEACVERGDFSSALKSIARIKRKRSLSSEDKVKFSVWLHWMGQSRAALKILGKALSREELSVVSDSGTFIRQVRIAHMYNYCGAEKMASRLYRDLEEAFRQTGWPVLENYPQYYNSLGNHFFQTGDYENAFAAFSQYRDKEGGQSALNSRLFFNCLGLCDCLVKLERPQEAIDRALALEELVAGKSNFAGIYYQALGSYHLSAGDIKAARSYLAKSEQEFSPEQRITKDYAYLKMSQAQASTRLEQKTTLLRQARDILQQGLIQPAALIEVLQLLQKSGAALSVEEEVALIPFCSSQLKGGEVYFFSDSFLTRAPYAEVRAKLASAEEFLDLKAACYFQAGVSTSLSDLEVRYLKTLMSARLTGIHELALFEKVYENVSYVGYENLLERLKKGIKRLREKFELSISWRQGRLKLEKNCPTIMGE